MTEEALATGPSARPRAGLGEFRRGWGAILSAFVGVPLGLIPLAQSYSIGVLSKPLTEAFDWSRSTVMLVPVVLTLAFIPASYVVGWIVDRRGARGLIMLSQVLLGLSFFALGAFTNGDARLFLGMYFLMGVMAAGALPIAFMRAIVTNFHAHRGLALAVAQAGSGVAGVCIPIYTAWVIETFGWRATYFALGALPILIALPVVFFFLKERPNGAPSAPDAPGVAVVEEGVSIGPAMATPRFWIMSIGFSVSLAVLLGAITSLVPLLTDRGFTTARAAEMAAVIGVSVIVGRIGSGFLLDRIWAPILCVGAFLLAAAALAILAIPDLDPVWTLVAIACIGMATGAEGDLAAFLVSAYFGRRCFGRIYATQWVLGNIGAGLGPLIFAYGFDRTGTYDGALLASAFAMAVTALAFLLLGPYPRFAETPQTDPGR